jgi:Protein of unknown function (DUF2892)
MTIERALRLMAGCFVLLSLGLGYWVTPYWLLFTVFVGLNLLQSGFTNWCPAMWFFKKLGLRQAVQTATARACCSETKPTMAAR